MGDAARVSWYRFQATFRARWAGLALIVVLVGLLGGLAMASVAGARRTQSSYPALLASTNPSALNLGTTVYDPSTGASGYDPMIIKEVAALPHVKHVEGWTGLNVIPLLPNGAPDHRGDSGGGVGGGSGSVDGLYFNQDRYVVREGRMAIASHADEFVTDVESARRFGWHIGTVVPFGVYTNAQATSPAYGSAGVTPYKVVKAKLVGTVVDAATDVVRDDVDGSSSFGVQFTPAFTNSLLQCCVPVSGVGIQLDHPSDLTTVEHEIDAKAPPGATPTFSVTAVVEAKAERAVKPESIALAVFGGIVLLATLLIVGQVIGRHLRRDGDDLEVLRALGAGPVTTTVDGLVGVVGAVVAGALLAVGVAVALSPLAPLGPARPFEPHSGIAFDWTVLGLGALLLVLATSAVAVVIAYRRAPHRVARRLERAVPRTSGVARAAAARGMPAPAVTGIRFALEPGSGRAAVPVRSAIVGAALAVVVLVGTITFGQSLNHLAAHPALYGWNWTYELSAGQGNGAIPQHQVTQLIDADHDVAAWTGVYFASLTIDGQPLPVIGTTPRAAVAPPILSGRGLEANDEIVLGNQTLAQLHKQVGDTVDVSPGGSAAHAQRLRIVGTATMPTIGVLGNSHPTMGTGALLSYNLISPFARNPYSNPVPGPNNILVRMRKGVSAADGARSLQRIAKATSTSANFGVAVVNVEHPAEIVNYRTMGKTPVLLGAALAAGAVVALGLTLVASVRRRRHDLALLKTVGFTRRQLSATVAWQATVAVAIGTVVGIPLGIVLGRSLWDVFAHAIDVVPQPAVSALTVLLVAVGALVLANLVAAVPSRQAARTKTAVLLRAE
jgi:hypothetical protein